MCGRFQLEIGVDDLLNFIEILDEVRERYHEDDMKDMVHETKDFFPGTKALVLTPEGLKSPIWGFPLEKKLIFNARSESIYEKKMFRQAMETRRCLIPANLFFEWQGKEKVKHEVMTPYKIMFLGGIYSRYPNAEGEPEDRFSIITRASQGDMLGIHPRSPLIIGKDDLRSYLSTNTPETQIRRLLASSPDRLIIRREDFPAQLSLF